MIWVAQLEDVRRGREAPIFAVPGSYVVARRRQDPMMLTCEATLDDEIRLRKIRLRKEPGGAVAQIDLGGTRAPDAELRAALGEVVDQHRGRAARGRLTYRFEVLIR